MRAEELCIAAFEDDDFCRGIVLKKSYKLTYLDNCFVAEYVDGTVGIVNGDCQNSTILIQGQSLKAGRYGDSEIQKKG